MGVLADGAEFQTALNSFHFELCITLHPGSTSKPIDLDVYCRCFCKNGGNTLVAGVCTDERGFESALITLKLEIEKITGCELEWPPKLKLRGAAKGGTP